MRWLIALEDEDERKAVTEALFRLGMDYIEGPTYDAAVNELRRGRFDVVLARRTRREIALLGFCREALALAPSARLAIVGARPIDDPRVVRVGEGTAEAVVEEALVRLGAARPKALRYTLGREVLERRTWRAALAHDGAGRAGYFAQTTAPVVEGGARAELHDWVMRAREVTGEGIAPVVDVGLGDELPFVFYGAPDVLPFTEVAERGGLPLPLDEVCATAVHLAAALAHMHEAGVCHGAILLSTCTIERSGKFWLAGAGLGGFGERLRPRVRDPKYPMPYSEHETAPEVVVDAALPAPTADVYQFGAVIYELVTGVHPAKRDDPFETYKALLEGDIKDARDLDGRIPEGIAGLLEACLARDPAERPADGRALLARVERAIPRPSFFARIFGGEFDPAALSRRTADRAAAGMRA